MELKSIANSMELKTELIIIQLKKICNRGLIEKFYLRPHTEYNSI